MDAGTLTFVEGPGQAESLALSIMTVAAGRNVAIDYDDLCAALGLSCTAVAARAEASPGWWMTFGRDAFVEPAARLFGLELRDLHPPDVAVDMVSADEFAQHWEYSYTPLIRRALENGQPVLAWQGWPDYRWPFWGVITGENAEGFVGQTLWSEGRPQVLAAPSLQCYVVERYEPLHEGPRRDDLLRTALTHLDLYMNAAPLVPELSSDEPPPVITGPAAMRSWVEWLQGEGATETPQAWNEHRQHADLIAAGHESAQRFLAGMQQIAGDSADGITQAMRHCENVAKWLAPSRDPASAASMFQSREGREQLLEGVRTAAAENRLLADVVHDLAAAIAPR